ncbi:MAG TPA: DUF2336 domain-containing protein [Geminicoccaceae bacterium]|nr:DUF2336 domain-containing protein [Geminicoccus sp.]HMU49561.1 DUF2336 domain-containing protein [Geminicoccaceae bacterium]
MVAQASVMAAGGQRRQAMLQRGGQVAPRAGLGMADVLTLQQDRSPQARAAVARKFGEQFDALSATHAELAEAVLGLLVRDVERGVREVLAETVAQSAALPPAVAVKLARDEIEVARPLLERSPVLDDATLVDIIRTNSMQYALATAARSGLSEAVTSALVDTKDRQVVSRVVGNAGARFSAETLNRVAEDWRSDSGIHDRLVRRPELPFELVEQLVGVIGDRLEWELVRKRQISVDQARQIMRATRERATISMVSREHGDRGIERRVRERMLSGGFGPETLLGYLRDGDIAAFEISLSLLSRLEPTRCRRLLYHSDRRHLAALCVKAAVPTPHYLTLRMTLELAEDAVTHGGTGRDYPSDTIRFLQQQYERLRGEPDAVDRLCFG